MSLFISDAHAQAAGAPPGGATGQLLILGVFVVVFYFLLIRPQQKRAKEHQAMLSKLAAGDEVATAGGILAKVVEVGEALPKVERAPLLGGGMLSGGSAGETMQTAADGVNPLPLAAQL